MVAGGAWWWRSVLDARASLSGCRLLVQSNQPGMTAFAVSAIPSSINTLERLLTWAAMSLVSASNGASVNVIENEPSQARVSCNTNRTADGVPTYIVAAYIPVDLNAIADPTLKPWMAAKDITTAQPHVNFTTN